MDGREVKITFFGISDFYLARISIAFLLFISQNKMPETTGSCYDICSC